MSTTPAQNEDEQEHQKSKKPAGLFYTFYYFFIYKFFFFLFLDTAFKQQRLPAWQPIITANTALPVFLIIGLTFIPIGIVLVVTSAKVIFLLFGSFFLWKIKIFLFIKVLEYDLDYTDTNCIKSNESNMTCASFLENTNYTGQSCTCFKNFTLDEDFTVCFKINKIINFE